MSSVTMKHIYKKYAGGVIAVTDFNLDIEDKEFIILVGPSGCGKSTTLRMIAGLEDITDGELYIGDRLVNDVAPKDRDIAMVFQNYALYPHMTVYDNMAFALKLRHESKEEIDRKVKEAAEILDITQYLGRKLRQRINTTFINVTHDQTEAMTLGDRIVIMKDGFIQQIGTPQEVFNHPYNLFVAGFIGTPQMNLFDAELVKEDGKYAVKVGGITVTLSDEKQANLTKNNVAPQSIVLGVRPEHIELTKEGIDAVVDVSEMMGSTVHLHVTSMGRDVVLVVSTMNMTGEEVAALTAGTAVKYSFGGHVCHVFNKESGINLEA